MKRRLIVAPLALALLAGCATVAPDGGFGSVAATARERTGAEPRLARDDAAARELAQAIVRDGEGATKFITVQVDGGKTEDECRQVAYAIAHSCLLYTSPSPRDATLSRMPSSA